MPTRMPSGKRHSFVNCESEKGCTKQIAAAAVCINRQIFSYKGKGRIVTAGNLTLVILYLGTR